MPYFLKMRVPPFTLIVLMSAAILLSACQGLGGEPQIVATLPPNRMDNSGGTSDQQAIAATMMLGGEVWEANCAECHGRLGEGTEIGAPLPDLTGREDDHILASVTTGIEGRMPAFGEKLDDEQLEAVSTYAQMISLARSRDMIGAENNTDDAGNAEAEGETPTEVAAAPLEMTDDPSVIQINRVVSQIEVLDDVLYILQIVQFVNTSDKVYFVSSGEGDGEHSSVSVQIPKNAQVQDMTGSAYQISDDGTRITDVQPAYPGQAHIMHLAYSLPYDDTLAEGVIVDQSFDYELSGPVEVLVATNGLNLTSDALAPRGTSTSGGVTITRYGSELTLPAGESVDYSISGIPVPPQATTVTTSPDASTSAGQNPLAYMLIGAGASALIIAGGLYVRERFTSSGRQDESPAQVGVGALIEQIAALDMQYQEGKLNADDYAQRRATLKAKVSALMKQ